MIVLTSTEKLQLVLSAGTADVDVNYNDRTATAYGPSDSQQTAATNTTNDICTAPAASTSREINGVSFYIKTTGGTATLQKFNSSGSVTTIIAKGTVAVGDNVFLTHGDALKATDASFNLKEASAVTINNYVTYSNQITSNVAGSATAGTFTDTGASLSLNAGTYIVSGVATLEMDGGGGGTGAQIRIGQLVLTDNANNVQFGELGCSVNSETPTDISAVSFSDILTVASTTTYKTRFSSLNNSGTPTIASLNLYGNAAYPHRIIATRIA